MKTETNELLLVNLSLIRFTKKCALYQKVVLKI